MPSVRKKSAIFDVSTIVKGDILYHQVFGVISRYKLFKNLPLMTSQVGVSTEMYDGQMSNVCYGPLGRLLD